MSQRTPREREREREDRWRRQEGKDSKRVKSVFLSRGVEGVRVKGQKNERKEKEMREKED